MTIAMPDSVTVADLPGGYPAYLGYADGRWPTETELRARFPSAELVILTVTGATAAHGVKIIPGIDDEPGNPDAAAAARWAAQQLAAGVPRPIVYADLASEGYSMSDVLAELAKLGVARASVRLLTAHYGKGQHICGPRTCGELPVDADGTQWTDAFPGVGGALIDMSLLADDFFNNAPAPAGYTWTEFDMAKLPVLKQGDADKPGSFWYVRRCQSLVALVGRLNGVQAALIDADGSYGPLTAAGVKAAQSHYGITQDGVCGAATWSVLLTGSPG